MEKTEVFKKGIRLLKRSIKEKWEPIVAGTGVDRGASNCPLCQEFLKKGCEGCPILIETGARECEKTPFREWNKHHKEVHDLPISAPFRVMCPTCKKLAQNVLGFGERLYKKLTLTT